jgi:hypothetical protein
VWDRTLDGRTLTFRLFGINNQNFIMRDEETGSWWQQVTGEAIQGPLRGRRLHGIVHDEVSFGIWRGENPTGRVLKPVAGETDHYEPADWERTMKKVRTVTSRVPGDPLAPRTVVVGVALGGRARAYPFPLLKEETPLLDTVDGTPIVLVVGDDHKSIRVFERTVGGRKLELLAVNGARPVRMVDAETGSEWDFIGRAVSGPLAGTRLTKVKALKEYWFDWRTYNPSTTIHHRGGFALTPP